MQKVIFSPSFTDFLKKNIYKSTVCRVLYWAYHRQKGNGGTHTNILTSKHLNYLTFRQDGTISYLPAGKECKVSESGQWSRDGRQAGKPAKVVKKLFTERLQRYLKDCDFEVFSNVYKSASIDNGLKFELLPAAKVAQVYDMIRARGGGTLNDSCMNGDGHYLAIYTNCPKLQILILTNNDGELCGRSLVWEVEDNVFFMDRVYVVEDYMYSLFLDYAQDHEWYRRQYYRTYDHKTSMVNPLGEFIEKEWRIMTDTDFDLYPYIDTFTYGGEGFLQNYDAGCKYTYKETNGGREGEDNDDDDMVYSAIYGHSIPYCEAVLITAGQGRYIDEYVYSHDAVCIGDDYYFINDTENIIKINDEWYLKDDDNIIEVDGEYYHIDSGDVVYCEVDDEYYLADDCIYCESEETYILKSDAVMVKGIVYRKSDVEEVI